MYYIAWDVDNPEHNPVKIYKMNRYGDYDPFYGNIKSKIQGQINNYFRNMYYYAHGYLVPASNKGLQKEILDYGEGNTIEIYLDYKGDFEKAVEV